MMFMKEVKFNTSLEENIEEVVGKCPALIEYIENPSDELVALAIESGLLRDVSDKFRGILEATRSTIVQIALVNEYQYNFRDLHAPTDETLEYMLECYPEALFECKKEDSFSQSFVDKAVKVQPRYAANYLINRISPKQFIDFVRKDRIHFVDKIEITHDADSYERRWYNERNKNDFGVWAKPLSWRKKTKVKRKFTNEDFEGINAITLTIKAKPWVLMCIDNPSKEFQKVAAKKVQKFNGLDHIIKDKDALDILNGYKSCEDIIA